MSSNRQNFPSADAGLLTQVFGVKKRIASSMPTMNNTQEQAMQSTEYPGRKGDQTMVARFSTKEVLDAAIRIEQDAAGFYRDAAGLAKDDKVKAFLQELSAMEASHAETFRQIQAVLSEKEKAVERLDPGNEMLYYLQASAAMHGWEGKKGSEQTLTGQESVKEILQHAIAAEKEAVFFYTGVRDLVPGDAGRDKVDTVLHEEMKHVAQLTQLLTQQTSG